MLTGLDGECVCRDGVGAVAVIVYVVAVVVGAEKRVVADHLVVERLAGARAHVERVGVLLVALLGDRLPLVGLHALPVHLANESEVAGVGQDRLDGERRLLGAVDPEARLDVRLLLVGHRHDLDARAERGVGRGRQLDCALHALNSWPTKYQ